MEGHLFKRGVGHHCPPAGDGPVRTFDVVLRNNLYRFFIQCTSSSNFFIRSLQMSDAFYKSSFFLNYQRSCMVETECSSCSWVVSVFASHHFCFCVVKICGHCVHTKHKKKVRSAGKVFCSSQGWTSTNTCFVMPFCMVIHFLCSCEWRYSCGDDKLLCFSQCWSCGNTVSVMCADV